jgi:hypothetical protein
MQDLALLLASKSPDNRWMDKVGRALPATIWNQLSPNLVLMLIGMACD